MLRGQLEGRTAILDRETYLDGLQQSNDDDEIDAQRE